MPTHNGDGHRALTAKQMADLVVGGELGAAEKSQAHEAGGERVPPRTPPNVLELHVCKGLNACVKHDVDATSAMAGTGRCATVQHVCHGDNQCRGQGGCGYLGSEYEQTIPGEQACRWNGSCASPINVSRVHSAGPYKGTSVWKLARKRFEERMYRAGMPFGPTPGEGCPDDLVPDYEVDREEKWLSEPAWTPVTTGRNAASSPKLPEYTGDTGDA